MRDMPPRPREALIEARKAMGLTQAAMARAIKRSRSAYTYYELGERTPPIHICLLISRILKRPVEELFGDVAHRDVVAPEEVVA